MAQTEDQVQLNHLVIFREITSCGSSEILKLLRLCDHKIIHHCNHTISVLFRLHDVTRLKVSSLMSRSSKVSQVFRTLLSAKACNIDTKLLLAGTREVIQFLIECRRLHLDERNLGGNTALVSANKTSHLQNFRLLIIAGVQTSLISRHYSLLNDSYENAFDVAQRMGLREALELLFRARSVNAHPLLFAFVENDLESFALLLKYNICDKNEAHNIRPDILCYVLRQTLKKKVPISSALEFVRELCRLGFNVNRCQYCKGTRIELALSIGSYELAEVLCTHGARVTHNNLLSAVKSQQFQMVPLLVNHGAPVDTYDHRGHVTFKNSALDIALERSSTSTARVLLQHGAHLDAERAFTQALKERNTKTLMYLLTECAEQTKAVRQKPEVLIEAVKIGDIHLIQLLLDAGADIDGVHNDETPLMSAVHIEVINLLLNKGASVNLKTNTTPLINLFSWKFRSHFSSTLNPKLTHEEMNKQLLVLIGMFLENGANVDATDEHENTALTQSVRNKCGLKVLKYLLDRGADVNQKDSYGSTALHFAAFYEKRDFVAFLLKHGALVNVKRCDGCTPLHEAVEDVDKVKILLENQADVNAKDEDGDTPLTLAVKNYGDSDDVVKLLIASGSDVNHRNKFGMSPLWLAAERLFPECLVVLIRAKADLGHDDNQQKSALSIVLDHFFPLEEVQQTATLLIEHGASAEFVKPDIIHRLIAAGNNGLLIQKLMTSGVCPSDIVLNKTIFNWPETSLSPLAVSLILDNADFVCYFFKNWFLTKSDIKILSRNKKIMSYLQQRESKSLSYLKEVSRQPMRLELLCFITVSSALGSDRGRRQRVNNSELPVPIQDKLLFLKVEKKVLEEVAEEGFNFLHELSHQERKRRNRI
ncbi:ankyrin repeat and KH domain-containing protein mask-1-like [Biomphalaria glabrata]|uniref:Ankyrin repeat and KH domain-containing protein mask-1-like n=1 Tax=Biomphalaria glabrata TaxID=6526 RepID=A0A9W3B0L3_BIOGL|nr:ankyrin repeat and KH domain-containing protein mask-1-like [Biomphalaria glabrata]